MKESISNNIFGKNEKVKKEAAELLASRFNAQERLEGEREKTEDEIMLIEALNQASNENLALFGLERFDVKPEHVHILDLKNFEAFIKKEGLMDIESSSGKVEGCFSPSRQLIALSDQGEDIFNYAYDLAHEMTHFKSYHSHNLRRINKWGIFPIDNLSIRRSGLSIKIKEGGGTAFIDVDEAMTDQLALITLRAVIGNAEFFDKLPQKIKEDFSVRLENKFGRSYLEEKIRFWELITEIYNKNKDRFKNEQEVFDVFVKGYFTGKILEAARLVENTFGKGSFRKIGVEGMPKAKDEGTDLD